MDSVELKERFGSLDQNAFTVLFDDGTILSSIQEGYEIIDGIGGMATILGVTRDEAITVYISNVLLLKHEGNYLIVDGKVVDTFKDHHEGRAPARKPNLYALDSKDTESSNDQPIGGETE